MKFLPYTLTGLLLFSVTSCDRGKQDEHGAAEQAEEDAPTNRIAISSNVRDNLGITFAKVERRKMNAMIRIPGAFELQPSATREYRMVLPGVIQLQVNQFDEVKAGDVLFRFKSPKWSEMKQSISLAIAEYAQVEARYTALSKRLESLKKADFKRADLDAELAGLDAERQGQRAKLDAELATAAQLLNSYAPAERAQVKPESLLEHTQVGNTSVPRYLGIDWIDVKAASSGVVKTLPLSDGAFAAETSLVITTVQPDNLRFKASGLQSDLQKFTTADSAKIVPQQAAGGNINDSLPAKLTLGLESDPTHRTLTLYATPTETRPWARQGITAQLEVITSSSGGPTLAIPRSAVVKDGITHVFFKRDPLDPNKAIRVEADLGIEDGRWVEIKSDLGPNDEVVLDGAYELKLASAQSGTSQKGGHFHADGTYHGEH